MSATSLADFYAGGPRTTAAAFPPACLRTHWDPTMVVKHVLPNFQIGGQLLDPRPASKICFQYHHTSAGDAPLPGEFALPTVPETPSEFLGGLQRPGAAAALAAARAARIVPPGGAAGLSFPYGRYNVDAETDVLRVDEPLTRCAERRYIPSHGVPAPADSTNVIPGSHPPAAPDVLYTPHPAGCRAADDAAAWERSSRLFFNPTRYDRTTYVPPNLKRAESIHALPFPY
jgi:hypothetical protein